MTTMPLTTEEVALKLEDINTSEVFQIRSKIDEAHVQDFVIAETFPPITDRQLTEREKEKWLGHHITHKNNSIHYGPRSDHLQKGLRYMQEVLQLRLDQMDQNGGIDNVAPDSL